MFSAAINPWPSSRFQHPHRQIIGLEFTGIVTHDSPPLGLGHFGHPHPEAESRNSREKSPRTGLSGGLPLLLELCLDLPLPHSSNDHNGGQLALPWPGLPGLPVVDGLGRHADQGPHVPCRQPQLLSLSGQPLGAEAGFTGGFGVYSRLRPLQDTLVRAAGLLL